MRNRHSLFVFSALAASLFAVKQAPAQTAPGARDIFSKYDFLGLFAYDCSKQPAESNYYFVNRPVDVGHVQRDRMVATDKRNEFYVFDTAIPLGPHQLYATGVTSNGKKVEVVWNFNNKRVAQYWSNIDGIDVVVDGKFQSSGQNVGWQSRCDDTQ